MAIEEHTSDMNWADYFDSLANQHLKRRIEEARERVHEQKPVREGARKPTSEDKQALS